MRCPDAILIGERRPLPALTLACALAATVALPALADVRLRQGPPTGEAALAAEGVVVSDEALRIGGKTVNELVIDKLVTSSRGRGATSRVDANIVARSRVGGDLTVQSRIGGLTQHAEGTDARAVTVVGTVNDTTVGGNLRNTVTVGSSTNIAIGRGAVACTELGIFGPSGVCR